MRTKIIEAISGPEGARGNHGKFLLGLFDSERETMSSVYRLGTSNIGGNGWSSEHFLMLDLATGEGAVFRHGGYANSDLNKHQIWVCPLFEPTLQKIYEMPLDLDAIPDVVELTFEEAPFAMSGYRRTGRKNRG